MKAVMLSAVALGTLTAAAMAHPIKLTENQMDQITAGQLVPSSAVSQIDQAISRISGALKVLEGLPPELQQRLNPLLSPPSSSSPSSSSSGQTHG